MKRWQLALNTHAFAIRGAQEKPFAKAENVAILFFAENDLA